MSTLNSFAVYGYQKSQEGKNRLVVDEYAAEIVQTIFQMKLQGINQQRIADFPNDNGVLSPLEYKKFGCRCSLDILMRCIKEKVY